MNIARELVEVSHTNLPLMASTKTGPAVRSTHWTLSKSELSFTVFNVASLRQMNVLPETTQHICLVTVVFTIECDG